MGKDSAALGSTVSTSRIVINKLDLLWVERGNVREQTYLWIVECKNGMRVEEMGKQSIKLSGFDTGELRSVFIIIQYAMIVHTSSYGEGSGLFQRWHWVNNYSECKHFAIVSLAIYNNVCRLLIHKWWLVRWAIPCLGHAFTLCVCIYEWIHLWGEWRSYSWVALMSFHIANNCSVWRFDHEGLLQVQNWE